MDASKQIRKIFDNKGYLAPIAEKSKRNFDLKSKAINPENRLHYFAVGHVFKNIDTQAFFKPTLNESLKKKEVSQFKCLQRNAFTFKDELSKLLNHIRNVNSHYIHELDVLEIGNFTVLLPFLKEAFELSVIEGYINEKGITAEEYFADDINQKKMVAFLCDKFYPSVEFQKEEREEFLSKSFQEAINAILFIEVDTPITWRLLGTHDVLPIKIGIYLSFYACLFLLSLFLYKNEANSLISKIKGFKRTGNKNRNDDNKFKTKRNIFSFFSKKMSSQDFDAEEQHLIKFRDIIQYLNHFPTEWNQELELEPTNAPMANQLKKQVIEYEINRSYPTVKDKQNFLLYAINHFFGKEYLPLWGVNELPTYTDVQIKTFEDEIKIAPILKGCYNEKQNLEKKLKEKPNEKDKTNKELNSLQRKIEKLEKEPNHITEKLKTRIANNMLFVSYGRNQDRFIDFAIRFLAEHHYFGSDAKFELYQFYDVAEQEEYIKELDKKQKDKLKYHQGKVTHYCTFADHQNKYSEWDTPFVIENNAVKIKLQLSVPNQANKVERTLSVQRNLLIYLLEHALYKIKNIENAGKTLFENYFILHQKDFEKHVATLKSQTEITAAEKSQFKKLLPKRLLYHYHPAQQNNLPERNTLQAILDDAEKHEQRYQQLLAKAKTEKREQDFLKHNKGKQFKLRFVRKAWNLMYFKSHYQNLSAQNGEQHHKGYNITKEEFNDFSRFMFAFDEVPQYKKYLQQMLQQKQFFTVDAFAEIFNNSNSLHDMYERTKAAYKQWIAHTDTKTKATDSYTLGKYSNSLNTNMWYINISHFINYLAGKRIIEKTETIQYKALENVPYLQISYYYKDKLDKSEFKSCGKLFNKLKTIKLEDALLYEIAMKYLKQEKSIVQHLKTNISEILKSTIDFEVKDKEGKLIYTLIVPFGKLENYLVISKLEDGIDNNKNLYLIKIHEYLQKVKSKEELKKIFEGDKKTNKLYLKFEGLHKINQDIITQSQAYTRFAMAMELYCITKHQVRITKENRISIGEIPELETYVKKEDRDNAFHFNIPNHLYKPLVENNEPKFIQAEVQPLLHEVTEFEKLPQPEKMVCKIFLQELYAKFYNRHIKNNENRTKEAQERYFYEVIKK